MPTSTPSPLGGHALLVLLTGVLVLLCCALLLGRVAARLGLPAVAGELCAGVLIGPSVLGRLAPGAAHWLLPPDPAQVHLLDAVGQLGVVLLVGITGIDVDLGLVRRRGRTALQVGVAGLVVPLALGVAAGRSAPRSLTGTAGQGTFALFIGVAMCVSALPVIAKMLSDMRLLHRDIGQLTIAAGVVDDVIGWMLLSLVSAAATVGLSGAAVWRSVGWLAMTLVCALVAGRPLVRRLLDVAGRSGESGPVICAAVAVVVAGAAATQAMGMEASFGAFVAGLLLGTAASERLRRLAPLRAVVLSVLAPLFFAEAGLRMDLTVFDRPSLVLAALAALAVAVLGKFAGALLGARLSRLGRWEALALAAGMNARGVIQIIVATVGLKIGVLNTASYTIVVLVAMTTSLMAPPLLRHAMARIPVTPRERAWRPKTGQPAGHG
ncbi:sodium:proton exchanger [Streptomyces fodineus]|uniref:Sodium:proton exchanger n=1 Tax=Streptomyces fodineus TaxID=1904616 RepID=A0A1D7YAE7_9ACTN|nr:cation:proton antiporter [Streptomyces fodineus]AOR32309.1 sodium:proton exchanger [Streptomyces fodineus]